ncbi:hypothetical protein BDW59DRAFT_140927 [Aspergillus cavernicola]|uniref:Uncharacterized protein n=1 Tax=Aspergillus cavernicola TaxID=176166 RepID=A0ABR4IVN8_9EURO
MADMSKNTPSENQQPTTAHKQPRYFPRLSKLILALASVLILLALFIPRSPGPQSPPPSASVNGAWEMESTESNTKDHDCPLPATRYNISTAQAACYPSSGGIWMASLGPLELQHLGTNRFKTTPRSPIQADEDAFCTKLRRFGGDWYNPAASGRDLFIADGCRELDEFMPVFSIVREIGFPRDGGVWVLATDQETGDYPDGMVTVRNALTMEERCMALEDLGAVYCDEVENCSPLGDLEQEPYEYAKEKGFLVERVADYL